MTELILTELSSGLIEWEQLKHPVFLTRVGSCLLHLRLDVLEGQSLPGDQRDFLDRLKTRFQLLKQVGLQGRGLE